MIGYEKGKNYCSFSPDRFFKWDWSYACYKHDRQYRNEVKDRLTRLQADQNLLTNMKRVLPKPLQFIAHWYYYVVRLIAWVAW